MLDFPELHRPLPTAYNGKTARGIFLAAFLRVRRAVLRAPPRMTVPEWADTYRHLALSAGAVGGPWRTDRVEVARGPMMAATELGVQMITLMVATQTLKTSLLENMVGYIAHLDPAPILLTQPKDESVGAFSKERLVPMVKATPVLRNLIGDYRVHRGGGKQDDTIRLKQFPGGLLAMASAGSPSNLAMRAIRFVFEDEIDKYETTKEGDPLQLAEERTATFPTNKLIIRACSPTWEETSRIFRSYQTSDQRRPFVKCPHCDYEQTLDFFRHVHWEKENDGAAHRPETAVIKCEACHKPWTEQHRQNLISGTPGTIRWFQTREFTCCDEKQNPQMDRNWKWSKRNQVGYAVCRECGERGVSNHHAGFQASKLYSPFITTVELATKWIEAKDDPETKQTFYNSIDVDTPLPTPNGWRRIGDIEAGEQVFGANGKPARVIGTSPVLENQDCYKITFADGSKIVASGTHLWQVRDNGGKCCSVVKHKIRILTTEDMRKGFRFRNRARYFIRTTKAVGGRKKLLPVDPYIFGLWLGDGTTNRANIAAGKQDCRNTVRAIEARGVSCRVTWARGVARIYPGQTAGGSHGVGKENPMCRALQRLSTLGDKKIPMAYLRANESQRWDLLRGLLDSDGFATKDSVRFCTTSPALRDGVFELMASLGLKPKIYSSMTVARRFNGYDLKSRSVFNVSVTPDGEQFFYLARKQKKVRKAKYPSRVHSRAIISIRKIKSRPVKCIEVDSSDRLYLCGRAWIPTHNTQLGLPFKVDAMKEVQSEGLAGRAEDYLKIITDKTTGTVTHALKDGVLPRQVLILTCGVDVQAGGSANEGRLEAEVTGYGLGEESWLVAKEEFSGNPAEPEVWEQLEEFLMRGYKHPTGHILRVAAACVDSGGHNTQDVYSFCRQRANRNVWAIKGATDKGNQWTPIWPARSTEQKKKYRAGFKPVLLGVNAAKEAIRQRLLIENPGPGYCHFPVGLPQSHYDQLTSERLVIEKKAGHSIRKWVLPKQRANEALDCRVYSYSALWGLRHLRRLTLERQFELLEMVPATADNSVEADEEVVKKLRERRVRRSRFMS